MFEELTKDYYSGFLQLIREHINLLDPTAFKAAMTFHRAVHIWSCSTPLLSHMELISENFSSQAFCRVGPTFCSTTKYVLQYVTLKLLARGSIFLNH